jgi:hypothetical protein
MVAKKKRSSRRGTGSARKKRRPTKGRRRQNRPRGRWRLVLALVVLLGLLGAAYSVYLGKTVRV